MPSEKAPESTENNSAQPDSSGVSDTVPEPEEAAIGTMLDKPEKVLELEEFYVSISYPDNENESGVKTMEIALKDKDEPGILYISDGMLKLHENIYELSSSGEVAKYTKDAFAETFTKDEESSAASLQHEVENLKSFCCKSAMVSQNSVLIYSIKSVRMSKFHLPVKHTNMNCTQIMS